MPIEANTLFEEAKCLGCNSDASLQQMLVLALLQRIAESLAGGGGAISANLVGVGSPVGVVTPAAIGQFYSDSTPGSEALYQAFGLTDTSWHNWI